MIAGALAMVLGAALVSAPASAAAQTPSAASRPPASAPAPAASRAPAPAQAPAVAPAHAAAPAASDPPPVQAASAEVDDTRLFLRAATGEIEVGEPLRVRLEVELAPGMEVRFENLGSGARPSLGAFEVRAARVVPTQAATPRLRVQEIDVVSFESGTVELPPLGVRLVAADGTETSAGVGPLRIRVRSLIGETEPREALRPVKDAVDIRLPRDWRVTLAIVAGAMALLAAGYAGWRLVRRPRIVPEIPPHEAARQALGQLRSENLPANGRVLEFYIRLSDIVRGYVEHRFGIRAPEQTTKEFLAIASHDPSLRDEHRVLLGGFLRSADRVKFAAERPGSSECDKAFDAANAFVDETAPSHADAAPPHAAAPQGARA